MIASAHITISDLNDPIQQGTAPASPVEGMLWLDTSVEPPQLRRWDGLVWGTVNDPSSLSVGGRNLMLNTTKNFPRPYRIATTDFPTKQTNVEVEEWGCTDAFRITGTQSGDSTIVAIFNYESHGMSVPARTIIGQQYTNSIYIKNNHAEKTIAVRPNAVDVPATNVLPGQAIRWHYSFTATTSAYHQIQIYVKASGDDFDITYWHPQIEFGNVVSDWSPAPEDTSAEILGVMSYAQAVKAQVDGKIDMWFYAVAPSASVPPENGWSAQDKADHVDDLYYNTATGYCYRYTVSGSTYSWTRIKDSDITSAANAASAAQDTADNKRRVFTTQPTPPYDKGDMWVQGESGDIKVCVTAKASGSYAAGDWALASKYTDDTAVNNLQIGGRNLIWRTLKPGVDLGARPCFNGLNGNTNGELHTSTGTLSVAEHGFTITNTDARMTVVRFGPSTGSTPDGNMLGLIAGETYTLSCDAEFKLLGGTKTAYEPPTQLIIRYAKPGDTSYTVGTVDNGLAYILNTYTEATKGTVVMKHVEFTFTIPQDASSLIFTLYNYDSTTAHYAAGDYITLRNLKLERGDKATDWSAAPEDTSSITVGGRNLLLNSATNFPQAYQGATFTKTSGVTVNEWACTDALRIAGTSGTSAIFALFNTTSHGLELSGDNYWQTKQGQSYTYSMYLKNNHATNSIMVRMNSLGTGNVTIAPGATMHWTDTGVGTGSGAIQINLSTNAAGDAFDVTYWHPMIEYGNQPSDWKPAEGDTTKEINDAAGAVQENLDNLSIGGRNYARAMDGVSLTPIAQNCSYTYDSDTGTYELVCTATGGYSQIYVDSYNRIEFPERLIGQKLIFHVDEIICTNSALDPKVFLNFRNDANQYVQNHELTPSTLQQVVIPPAGTTWISVGLRLASNQRHAVGDRLTVRGIMLEEGTHRSGWVPADEDVRQELEMKVQSVSAQINEEGDRIRSEVRANYVLASDMSQLAQTVSTISEQTENNYTWSVNRINQLQTDMDNANSDFASQLQTISTYMKFGEDGLSIGKTGNPFTFRVSNDRLVFYNNNAEVAYLSNNKLYITHAEVLTDLILGRFAFVPQANGNMSLVLN